MQPPNPQFQNIITAANEEGAEDFDQKLAQNEKKEKFDDHKRAQSYKKHLHNIVICGIYAIGLIVVSLILIRAWHLATPEKLKWLSDGQLHSIDAVLFSSIIFSLASKYFSYYKLFDRGHQ